jgi:hypothetical protein
VAVHLTEYDQALIVIGVVASAFLMFGIGAGLVYHRWRLEKMQDWIAGAQARDLVETLKAIEAVRDQIDAASLQSGLEHRAQMEALKLVGGRTQWLVANEIARGLSAARDRAEQELKEDERRAGIGSVDGPGT